MTSEFIQWKSRSFKRTTCEKHDTSQDELMEKIVSHDSWDWQSCCVNDVKAVVEEEGKEFKEADAYDRTENKMRNGKCLFVCFFRLSY